MTYRRKYEYSYTCPIKYVNIPPKWEPLWIYIYQRLSGAAAHADDTQQSLRVHIDCMAGPPLPRCVLRRLLMLTYIGKGDAPRKVGSIAMTDYGILVVTLKLKES